MEETITAYDFLQRLGDELSSGVLELPSFPDVAVQVRKALDDPDSSAETIARIVSVEPSLVARLLRIANSAAINPAGSQVTDLPNAVSRLGFNLVRNTAVSCAMEQTFDSKDMGPFREEAETLWEHSVRVASLSYILARKHSSVNPDEAMLAGLLHDIGKLYMFLRAKEFPELFEDIQALKEFQQQWHPGIGRAILEAWNFSDEIVTAVDEHESLDRAYAFSKADLTDVVVVANILSYLNSGGPYDDVDLNELSSCKRMKLNTDACKTALEESEEEYRSLMQALA